MAPVALNLEEANNSVIRKVPVLTKLLSTPRPK
jgi:hypothetical protein